MDVVDLDDATTELYALTPAEFTARRAELAAQARKEGLKDLAKQISELRRPTVSAWLVNQLARGAGGAQDDIEELEQLGVDLRTAQAELDGARMKELTKQRQKLVAALVRRADAVGDEDGQKVSAGARRELEETFGAAVADEQASLAVTSGNLTRALVYAGFGEVDVSAATATPVTAKRRPQPVAKRHSGQGDSSDQSRDAGAGSTGSPGSAESTGGERDARREQDAAERKADAAAAARAAAKEDADLARADQAAAIDDLEAATRHRDELRAEEVRLSERLDELQREIVRVRHELDNLTRSTAAADRDHQRRQRQVDQAGRAVRQADEALARLSEEPPD
jgi:hypothetical protein